MTFDTGLWVMKAVDCFVEVVASTSGKICDDTFMILIDVETGTSIAGVTVFVSFNFSPCLLQWSKTKTEDCLVEPSESESREKRRGKKEERGRGKIEVSYR